MSDEAIEMWDSLPDDVKEELLDERFDTRSHYSRATYAQGCHGPLCRLAETDRGRRRNEARAAAASRDYTPGERATEREPELRRIIAWHRQLRAESTQPAEVAS